jgi:hypothetical protein
LKRKRFLLNRFLLIVLLALPLHAGNFELGIQHVVVIQSGETGDLDVPLSRGFAATGEWFYSDAVSTHLAATFINPEAILFPSNPPPNDIDLGTLGQDTYSITARYHFRRGARLSPYVGAGAGYIVFGNLDDQFGDDFEATLAPELAPIVEGGVRYRFRRAIILTAALRYMPVTASVDVKLDDDPRIDLPEELEVNPIQFSVGAAWRF